ncbi:hypothetical protein ACOSQ4_007301 [Xanthoceras sorbifolium]
MDHGGGCVIKRVLDEGDELRRDLDEVLVKYQVTIGDSTVVAKTPQEGIEFYANDGNLQSSSGAYVANEGFHILVTNQVILSCIG